jgi:hypothetical protein
MSARARQTAVSRFATDRIIPQYEEVYRELIG